MTLGLLISQQCQVDSAKEEIAITFACWHWAMTVIINAINAKDIGRFSIGADEGMADITRSASGREGVRMVEPKLLTN